METRTSVRALLFIGAAGLVVPSMISANRGDTLSALAGETLAPIDGQMPEDFGASPVDGLEYADPVEALSLIEAPEANESGSVELGYPIDVPPGHGITPELNVTYDSGGGNGWVGNGWSLDVPSITVDTTFGAPHFDAALESESYLHDGELLVPNALADDWEPRVAGSRADYTHQVESEYSEIIRHEVGAGGPANYFWEVRGLDGGVRWYGGTPDSGGPVPDPSAPPTLDPDKVIRDDAGNIVEWLLAAERDIGVNLIRYEYETVYVQSSNDTWGQVGTCRTDQATACVPPCSPTGTAICGRHTYLASIFYTDATSAISGFNGPPYEIRFTRDAGVRADPIVDASRGYVDVLRDRLTRIEVLHGAPPASGSARTYTGVAARYDFVYGAAGWFGKSLLRRITQGITNLHHHDFDYFNELGAAPGTTTIDGFADAETWSSGDDVATELYLDNNSDISVLGGSETNAGSGQIYIGFNPVIPSKNLSAGVGLEFSGADTTAISEWIDLNGDGLPDKVFESGSEIKFRLNTGSVSNSGGFSDTTPTAANLPNLSKNSNFSFQISVEAYPVVAIGVGTGKAFTWSNRYFTDVNADGLIDFVNDGSVWFNHLDAAGIPTFSTSSASTPVPLEPSALPAISSDAVAEIEAEFAAQSPPIDTVRRFVAPFDGSITIDAPVALDASAGTTEDGVRVAVQHNGSEIASAQLAVGSASAFAAPIVRAVSAGDRIYFRSGAVEDGRNDAVSWAPTITYAGSAGPDANGRSQTVFSSAADFTLAGRPGSMVAVPNTGTIQVAVDIDIAEALTDEVELVVEHYDATLDGDEPKLTPSVVVGAGPYTVAAGTTGLVEFDVPVAVESKNATSTGDADGDGVLDEIRISDGIAVSIVADSTIDVTDIDWTATLTYTAAFDDAGDPVDLLGPDGQPFFEESVGQHVSLYPHRTPATPDARVSLPDTFEATATVDSLADASGATTATATFKNDAGTVKYSLSLSDATKVDFDVDLSSINTGGDYFVEIAIADANFGRDGLGLIELARYDDATKTDTTAIDGRLRWTGVQGLFPLASRGWGVAGYTTPDGSGGTAIDEAKLVIDDDGSGSIEDPDFDDLANDGSNLPTAFAFTAVAAGSDSTTETPVATDRWMLASRAPIYGDAAGQGTSRLMTDAATLAGLAGSGGGTGTRAGPARIGEGGPGVAVMFGIGPLGGSFAWSPSEGLNDFEDLNGDGYPDLITAGSVAYTNQIGDYLAVREVAGTDTINREETFSVQAGLDTGLVDIVPNAKGGVNPVKGSAAGKGGSASDSGPAYSLGISASGGYSWTNSAPDADNAADRDALIAESDSTSEPQQAFADVNGDGLADRITANNSGVFVAYNTGYGFTTGTMQLAVGGFESRESASGGFGLGFSIPYGEFGGGINFLWNYDWSKYTWRDVNGDGILDQLRRDGDAVTIAFGTGSGLLDPVSYGSTASANVTDIIEASEHITFDRSSGIGGGVNATGYIGPLCLVACYIVIGGGGGYNNSRSTSSIDVQDVDGDGYADVVFSEDNVDLDVHRNRQGKTNLLRHVDNPLGGRLSVDYARDGNTTAHPDSIWVMSALTIDDGNETLVGDPATPVDVSEYRQTFTYEGLAYDRALRSSLGYSRVTTVEHGAAAPMRQTVTNYLNGNVFTTGLATDVTISDLTSGTAVPVRGSTIQWGFRNVQEPGIPDFDPQDAVTLVEADDLVNANTVGARGWSIAPLVTARSEYWYAGSTRIFEHAWEYVYDGLGNVLTERDLGDPDAAGDDIVTDFEFSECTLSSSNGCLPDSGSPLWSPTTCVNWASYPVRVHVQIRDASGGLATARERTAYQAMCDNGAVTQQRILVEGGATPVWAVTDMTVNAYGDHELIMAPPGDSGVRYTVRYLYDADRHTDIASVEEFDVSSANAASVLANGPTPATATAGISSSATFDPLSGRVATRTDANGATRTYEYDDIGRLDRVTKMATTGTGATLIDYVYRATSASPHAIARHTDDLNGVAPTGTSDANGGDTTATIDTYTFVDGLARVTQTKRDAFVVPPGATSPIATRQVTGTASFDALARPVVEYGPVVDLGPAGAFSGAAYGGKQTSTAFDIADRVLQVVEPGNRTTAYSYLFVDSPAGTVDRLDVTETDPEQRVTMLGGDQRGNQLFHIDQPAPRVDAAGDTVTPPPPIRTNYVVNALGETLAVVDSTGARTEYAFDLVGQLRRVQSPNAGRTEFAYDRAGRLVRTENEVMRAGGTATTRAYTFNRLTAIDHPGVVDDITYVYGSDNTDGRFTAGRLRRIDDRTRILDRSYDSTGALIAELAEIKRHNWSPNLTEDERVKFQYLTQWTTDELGRLDTVVMPDAKGVDVVPDGVSVAGLTGLAGLPGLIESVDLPGEVVTYHYDSGGMLASIDGAEEGVGYVAEPIDEFVDGVQTIASVPRLTTYDYDYLTSRTYDHRLLTVRDAMGNGTVSTYDFDADTRWLDAKRTTSTVDGVLEELQDITYEFDDVGRPTKYTNDLPFANRAINGGSITQSYFYDGFGRTTDASGSFRLKDGQEQVYSYGAGFEPSAPWSIVDKEQDDELLVFRSNGSLRKRTTIEASTYDFARDLGTADGPLRVVDDVRTDADGDDETYAYEYNANGGVESMLLDDGGVTTTTTAPKGKGKGKGGGGGDPTSATNVWDREFTWNALDQLLMANAGSEVHTFAYDDEGILRIQDGSVFDAAGNVVVERGGGPEIVFLNDWVVVRSQKIYKQIVAGRDRIMAKKDSGASLETSVFYNHTDLVGSTNIVSDRQGRGFQRHEYFPSGEIWIDDRKEEVRTPFQFAEGYYEDDFDIVLFGERWYDTERELFLSPDSVIADDPDALVANPALGGEYTYAGANPVSNVDPTGQKFFSAHQRAKVLAASNAAYVDGKPAAGRDAARDKVSVKVKRQEKAVKIAEFLDTDAIVVIDANKGEVSVGFPYKLRKTWDVRKDQPAPVQDAANASDDDELPLSAFDLDASSSDGSPNAGGSPAASSESVGEIDIGDDSADSEEASAIDAPLDGLDDASTSSAEDDIDDDPPRGQGAVGADTNATD